MVSKSLSNYTNNIFCFKLKTIFYSEIITLKLLIIKNLTIGLVPFEWTVCLFVHILGGVWVHVWDSHYSDFFISHNPSTGGSWITGWATAPRRWSHCEGYLLNQHTFYRLQSQPIKHSFFFSLPLSWTAVWKWLLLFLAVHIPLLWVKQLSWAFKDLSASSAGLSIRAQTSHSCSSGSALRLSSAQWGNFLPLNCILLQLF